MKPFNASEYKIHPEVARALGKGTGVVALESTVLTHGLPYPVNLELGLDLEKSIKDKGVLPATIALIDGKMLIGVTNEELSALAQSKSALKVSNRMMGIGLALGLSGGTTVAATLVAAHLTGIQVFATGGIGGVHRGNSYDISADLDELARRPVIVVCAGAKAILDLPATLEALETRGVPVLGYQTNEFPAFYSRHSGLNVDVNVQNADEISCIAKSHWKAGNQSAVLVCNPIPLEYDQDYDKMNKIIEKAVIKAVEDGVHGSALSPYLLEHVSKFTKGKSLQANLALLKSNALLAAEIAAKMASPQLITY